MDYDMIDDKFSDDTAYSMLTRLYSQSAIKISRFLS